MPRKDSALTKIESHEKLCRLMQKQHSNKLKKLKKEFIEWKR